MNGHLKSSFKDDFIGHQQLISTACAGHDVTLRVPDWQSDKLERPVTLRSIYAGGGGQIYFHALCHINKNERLFNAYKVQAITMASGKMVTTRDYLLSLGIPLWKNEIRLRRSPGRPG